MWECGGADEKSRAAHGESAAKFCIMALELMFPFIRQRMSSIKRKRERERERERKRERDMERKWGGRDGKPRIAGERL